MVSVKFYTVKQGSTITHNPSEFDTDWEGIYGKEYIGGELFPHVGMCDRSFHHISPFLDLHLKADEPNPTTEIDDSVGETTEPDSDIEPLSDESGAESILDSSEPD